MKEVIKMERKTISLQKVVGRGYKEFCNSKKRYVVVKGSRASKKSKTTALWHIVKLIEYPLANVLVVRKTERTLRDSCYSDLKWAIQRLGLESYFSCTVSPLEITYKPTGQKILFRGMDDPLKLTSISVPQGYICFCCIEEAYEINKESDFDMLDESIRGELPSGLFKRLTITFNPWSERHWLKKRFFDKEDDSVLALTTNYLCNEWLDESDKALFERMKANNPRRYQVAGLGNWGIVDGLIFENWKEEQFNIDDIKINCESIFGLDFGYTNDPTALFCGLLDKVNKKIYVFDEIYEKGLSNAAIYQRINDKGFSKELITADCAEPKSIDELRGLGLRRITAAKKGKDSIMNGIQFIQDYEIIIHPKCVNFLTEISNYTWDKDKFGNAINKPVDDFNHLMDAMRYAIERHINLNAGWF